MTSKGTTLSFWELTCLTGTALGFPAMIVGGKVAASYGAGTAITSIFIGNILLWLLGLGIITMAKGNEHAVQNVREYLGKNAAVIVALILVFSFLIWYSLQIRGASIALGASEQYPSQWIIGIILGLAASIVSLGGIKTIKWITLIGLPILIIFACYAIIISDKSVRFQDTWNLSFSGIFLIVFTWLPFSVNLPTVFRFSRSRMDSVLGLTLKTIMIIFFQIFPVLTNISHSSLGLYFLPGNLIFNTVITFMFVILAYICVNLLNIYFASVCWETILPQSKGRFEYILAGIFGTTIYLIIYFIQSSNLTPYILEFIETTLTSFISNLGIVLLISYLIRILIRHRLRPKQKLLNTSCWVAGCVVSLIAQTQTPAKPIGEVLIIGVVASILFFLVMMFIEETIWSLKSISRRKV